MRLFSAVEIYKSMGVTGRRDSVIGVAIRQQTGRPRNRGSIPSSGMRLYLSQSVQTGSGAHTTTSSMSTVGSFSQVWSNVTGGEVTSRLHLIPKLMGGYISPFSIRFHGVHGANFTLYLHALLHYTYNLIRRHKHSSAIGHSPVLRTAVLLSYPR